MRYLKQATKPRGRNIPGRKKLAQRTSYPAGYARDLVVRFIEVDSPK